MKATKLEKNESLSLNSDVFAAIAVVAAKDEYFRAATREKTSTFAYTF